VFSAQALEILEGGLEDMSEAILEWQQLVVEKKRRAG